MGGEHRLRAHDRDRNYLGACLGPISHRPQLTCSGGGTPARLEIDKLTDGRYRSTVGTLFEYQEICRTRDLEALARHPNAMAAACRSFDDVVRAFRAMRMLG
jgi:hypothetical protein